MFKKFVGKKVIVRGRDSGVFYGELVDKNGTDVEMHNCRRLWYWEGAATLSQLAVDGSAKPDKCKFTMYVDQILITDCLEIIPCTEKAIANIDGIPAWRA